MKRKILNTIIINKNYSKKYSHFHIYDMNMTQIKNYEAIM